MLRQMKKGLLSPYSFMILIVVSCSSCKNRTPAKYFDRPMLNECITLKNGMMACNGEPREIPLGMTIPDSQSNYNEAFNYCENKEFRLYECLRYGRCN